MLLWTNLPDIRPSSPYLSAWLNHLDGLIAHRIHSRVFAHDWKWLVMVPRSGLPRAEHDLLGHETFAARHSPSLGSFWMTSREIDRMHRQAAPLAHRSRPRPSFWESVRAGVLNASLQCKELSFHPVPPPPAPRDFFPYTFLPDDPLRFTHGLALRVGLLTGRELHQTLQTVGQLMQSNRMALPMATDVWWRTGVAALELVMRQWPDQWPLWGEEHMSLRRSILRPLLKSSQELFLPAQGSAGHFPAGCELFAGVVRHVLSHREALRGAPSELTASAAMVAGMATGSPAGRPEGVSAPSPASVNAAVNAAAEAADPLPGSSPAVSSRRSDVLRQPSLF